MNYTIEDHIGVFDDVMTYEQCSNVIRYFDDLKMLNKTTTRTESENVSGMDKDNNLYHLDFTDNNQVFYNSNIKILDEFNNAVDLCYKLYRKKYHALDNLGQHRLSHEVKIQKTSPGEGYHIWHCEQANITTGRRLLLVMLYLNDLSNGGETEFLYQHKRIEPKSGRMVIVPSGFTHTHRGNPPLKGDKYMINGWIEFIE